MAGLHPLCRTPPSICHLKLFRYFNDFGHNSLLCCGGRGTAPFPAGAASRRQPCDGDHHPPMQGIPGLPSPRRDAPPGPGMRGGLSFLQWEPFPLTTSAASTFQVSFPQLTAIRDRSGDETPPCPRARAGPACRSSLEKAQPVNNSGSVCLEIIFFFLVSKKSCQFGAVL